MIFFLKADGTLIKSAPDTVYQGSAEAGKIYVVAPLNAGMLVDVYYELPNGERWGAYLLENNGKVIDDADLPEGWALWSTSLASAITQYAGTLKAQFGFYQSGTADKVPLITSQAVAITIAKGVVRDLPEAPTTDVYEQILNALSSIKQDIANLPNEYLANTNEDKIALKNNKSIPYEKDVSGSTIVQRDEAGRIKALRGENENDVVNVSQLDERAKTFRYVGGPDDFTDVNGGLTVKKGMNVDGPMKANTAPKADNEVVRLQELKAAEIEDLGAISDIDLNTGDTTVEYDTDLGITVNAKGTITRENGFTERPTTKFEVPIVASDGIIIDKTDDSEKIAISGKNFRKVVTGSSNEIKVYVTKLGDTESWMFLNADPDGTPGAEIPQYGPGGTLRANMPTTVLNNSVINKGYADTHYLRKSGGTITGNLIVSGNLSVSGETSVIESTTLKVADKLIYVAKDNISALTSPAGLITPKYDGTNDGGLVYDNSGTAYVGDIKLDDKGNVDVNNSDLQPIATRDNYSNFTNGHKVKAEVDSSQKSVKFIDGGKDDGINSLTDVNLTLGDTTVQYDTANGIQITSTGRFTYAGGNHDATIDLDLPIIGTNGIVIDKAADSEKIEISGKNLIKDPYPGVNNTGADIVNYKPYGSSDWGSAFVRNTHSLVNNAYSGSLVGYDNNGIIYAKTTSDDPWSVVNKEYAEAHYAQVVKTEVGQWKIYASRNGDPNAWLWGGPEVLSDMAVVIRANNGCIYTNMPDAANMKDTTVPNKKYMEDNFLKVYDLGVIGPGEVKIPAMRRLDETTNEQKWYPTCVGEYVANSAIALTDAQGHLGTNTPTAAKHCANKEYVDNVDEEKTLYRHDLRIMRTSTSSVFGYSIYCSFYSSSNLSISSLTDLRTVLGNLFTLMATGYLTGTDANYDPIEAIFQSGVRPIKNTDQTYDNATFSDTVTKII